MAPCFTQRIAIEAPKEPAYDQQHRFVDRAGDRQEAERDQGAQGLWDAAVTSEDFHGAYKVPRSIHDEIFTPHHYRPEPLDAAPFGALPKKHPAQPLKASRGILERMEDALPIEHIKVDGVVTSAKGVFEGVRRVVGAIAPELLSELEHVALLHFDPSDPHGLNVATEEAA